MNKILSSLVVLSGILLATSGALAQPKDPYVPADPDPKPPPPNPDGEAGSPPAEGQPPAGQPPLPATADPADAEEAPIDPFDQPAPLAPLGPPAPLAAQPRTTQPPATQYKGRRRTLANMRAPQLLSVPTAHLLPAAIVYSTTSVDTGGSIGGSLRVGLGDVGEFGLETSPLIRIIPFPGQDAETIQPLIFATFKMGVSEEHLFKHQPALALGFRKSFNRKYKGNHIRAAAIELTASKTFGGVSLHGGAVFWDAELEEIGGAPVALHDDAIKRQIRPFGGIEAEPFKDAQLLIDVAWVPLFRPGQSKLKERIELRPSLSWGIRYVLSRSVSLESGVRVPDIGEANLLDAQIFGQFTFASDKIRRALGMK